MVCKPLIKVAGHKGQEEEYRCSSTLSLSLALDRGMSLIPHLCHVTTRKEIRHPSYRTNDGLHSWSVWVKKILSHRDASHRLSSPYWVTSLLYAQFLNYNLSSAWTSRLPLFYVLALGKQEENYFKIELYPCSSKDQTSGTDNSYLMALRSHHLHSGFLQITLAILFMLCELLWKLVNSILIEATHFSSGWLNQGNGKCSLFKIPPNFDTLFAATLVAIRLFKGLTVQPLW